MKGWMLLLLIALCGWLALEKLTSWKDSRFNLSDKKEARESEAVESEESTDASASTAPIVIGPNEIPVDQAPVPIDPPKPLILVTGSIKNSLTEEQVQFLRQFVVGEESSGTRKGSLSYDPITGVFIANIGQDLEQAFREAVAKMDVRPRQATVEVVLVVASLSHSREFGLRWLLGWQSQGWKVLKEGSISVGGGNFGISAGLFEASLRRAIAEGDAAVISRPTIGVILGRESSIVTGREIPLVSVDNLNGNAVSKVDFREVALSLIVKLDSTEAGYLLEIEQNNDDVISSSIVDGQNVPDISTQKLQTRLEVPPGVWVSAGSVLVGREAASHSGIFEQFPGQRSASESRSEIGVFVRVLDGIEAHSEDWEPPAVPNRRDSAVDQEIRQAQPEEPVFASEADEPLVARPVKKELFVPAWKRKQ